MSSRTTDETKILPGLGDLHDQTERLVQEGLRLIPAAEVEETNVELAVAPDPR